MTAPVTPVSDFQYFIENVVYSNGFAKSNNFYVMLNDPAADTYFNGLLCDEVIFPSKTIISQKQRINNKIFPIAKKADYQEDAVTLTFNIDARFNIVEYFNNWISKSINTSSKTSEYYDNYVRPIDLVALSNEVENFTELGQITVRLYEAYPIGMENINVSYGTPEVAKIKVKFIFKYWDILYLPTLENVQRNTELLSTAVTNLKLSFGRAKLYLKIPAGDLAHLLRQKFLQQNEKIGRILRKVDSIPFVPFRRITRRF